MRVFFALSLSSAGIGQNSSMAADQGKAAVSLVVHTCIHTTFACSLLRVHMLHPRSPLYL
jgi:hypothetical protein